MCLELLKSTYRIEAPSRPRLYEFAHEVASRMGRDVPITFYQTQKAEGLNVSICFLPGKDPHHHRRTGPGAYVGTDGLSEDGAEQARILPVDSVLASCIGILGKLGIIRRQLAATSKSMPSNLTPILHIQTFSSTTANRLSSVNIYTT